MRAGLPSRYAFWRPVTLIVIFNMKACPDCKNELIAIDSKGLFSFQKRASRILWVISMVFLGVLWSILVPKIVPENISSYALAAYYILITILIIKLYKSNKSKIIYECTNCKNKFSDTPLKPFTYGK